jgi:hypothetical protein
VHERERERIGVAGRSALSSAGVVERKRAADRIVEASWIVQSGFSVSSWSITIAELRCTSSTL